jgi:hypothetical protein
MITCSEQEFKFDLVIEEAGQHIEWFYNRTWVYVFIVDLLIRIFTHQQVSSTNAYFRTRFSLRPFTLQGNAAIHSQEPVSISSAASQYDLIIGSLRLTQLGFCELDSKILIRYFLSLTILLE